MSSAAPQYLLDDLVLDTGQRRLTRGAVAIPLSRLSYALLLTLVEEAPNLVPHDELARKVWGPRRIVTPENLAKRVMLLRKALGDTADRPRYIEGVRGHGYRLVPAVRQAPHPFAELAAAEALAPSSRLVAAAGTRRSRIARRVGATLAAVLVLGSAAFMAIDGSPPARPALELTFEPVTDFSGSALAPALSPDGRMVAFLRGGEEHFLSERGQIWVKLLPNGEPVRLTDDPRMKFAPAFSPDGAYVAYTVFEPNGWNTYRVSVLGGRPELMLQNASGLTWLKDGRLLYSVQRGSIHMGLVTATPGRTEERDVYWPAHERGMAHLSYGSPNGRWALVVEMDHHPDWQPCRLVPLDGSSPGRLVGPAGACTGAAWSPDGEWMYFSVLVGGRGQLWRQRFPDGAPEQLAVGPAEAQGVAVDPGGRSLITSLGLRRNELWLREAHGERPISTEGTVATHWDLWGSLGWASVPSFSSDGRFLYYVHRREPTGSRYRLWRTEVATGRSEPVTELPVSEYDLSPDGREVVFSSEQGDGTVEIWRAPTDKSRAPQRLASGHVATPHFGGDGRVLFTRNEGTLNRLFRMNTDGSEQELVVPFPIASLQTVSPDGRWVVAMLQDAVGAVFSADGRGAPMRLCGGCYAQWGPDGRWFYVRPPGSGGTLALPVEPGEAPPVPPEGIRSAADHALIPGAIVLDVSEICPGLDPSTYAYLKPSIQRNLYRVFLD